MTKLKTLAVAVAFAVISSSAFAYQVTGPILELTDSKIVVQKGKEKWELARSGSTQIPVDAKVGDKVTVEYGMNAEKVEVKGAPTAKKAEKATTAPAAAPASAPAAPAAMKAAPKAPAPVTAH